MRFSATLRSAVAVVAVWAVPLHHLGSQGRPALVGSVGASAFGPPAPTPRPIGGLTGRPLQAGAIAGSTGTQPINRGDIGTYRVIDAAIRLRGVTVSGSDTDGASDDGVRYLVRERTAWVPTADPPRWVIDSTVTTVDAWRDLIVRDVVCNGAGICALRTHSVRARWMAYCGCYAFTDGWNRLWRVE